MLSVAATLYSRHSLPASRHFEVFSLARTEQENSLWTDPSAPGLRLLYCIGVLMGSFVTFFDYICYRLAAATPSPAVG